MTKDNVNAPKLDQQSLPLMINEGLANLFLSNGSTQRRRGG